MFFSFLISDSLFSCSKAHISNTPIPTLPIYLERNSEANDPEAYVFMIGGIVGASSVFVGWYYKFGQRRYINRYMTRIETTYDTLHETEEEQCIRQLRSIRKELLYLFKKGSLSDSHYNILDKKASDYIESIRRGEEYL